MGDVTNIRLGTCTVNFNGVDLGHTDGPIEYTYEPKYADIMVDLYGETPVEKKLIGEIIKVKALLAEYTINNLRNALPQTEFAGAANTRVTIGHKAGQSASARAYPLVLHPVAEGTRKFDIVLYKAFVESTVVLKHENKAKRVIEVTFVALLDETKADGNYLGLIGDSTT